MKEAFLPWLLAVVIGTGIVYSLTMRKPFSTVQPADVTTAPANQATPAQNPVKKKAVTVATTVADSVPQTPEPNASLAEPKAAPARPARPTVEVASFDSKKFSEITPGMTASNVVDVLGTPALSAVTVNRGGVQETYVYSRKPRDDRFAVIRLEDGKVTSMFQ